MSDAVPPLDDDTPSSEGPVPYVPQGQPARPQSQAQSRSSGFNPRLVVHPEGLSRQEAVQSQVPAPYPAYPGWAGEPEQPPRKAPLLDRVFPKQAPNPDAKPAGPLKPFLAGFLFGVSLVLIIGHGWNDPESVGPAWTLPSDPAGDQSFEDATVPSDDGFDEF